MSNPKYMCEHGFCTNLTDERFIRLREDCVPDEDGEWTEGEIQDWLPEPIALCFLHCEGRKSVATEGGEG